MASDYNTAGIKVEHNLYMLRSIVEDLIKGYFSDAHEHRHIAVSKDDLADCIDGLQTMITAIEKADTSGSALADIPQRLN